MREDEATEATYYISYFLGSFSFLDCEFPVLVARFRFIRNYCSFIFVQECFCEVVLSSFHFYLEIISVSIARKAYHIPALASTRL